MIKLHRQTKHKKHALLKSSRNAGVKHNVVNNGISSVVLMPDLVTLHNYCIPVSQLGHVIVTGTPPSPRLIAASLPQSCVIATC